MSDGLDQYVDQVVGIRAGWLFIYIVLPIVVAAAGMGGPYAIWQVDSCHYNYNLGTLI